MASMAQTVSAGSELASGARGGFFSGLSLFGSRRADASRITPGRRFRQRENSVWEVVRLVEFAHYPIPHVELVNTQLSPPVRKVISVDALLDRSLYRIED